MTAPLHLPNRAALAGWLLGPLTTFKRSGTPGGEFQIADEVIRFLTKYTHHWQHVEPGTLIKEGTLYRRERLSGSSYERIAASDFLTGDGTFIDPRTVPAPTLTERIRAALDDSPESRITLDVADVEALLDQLDAAEAALARVRELHERESFWQYDRDQECSYLTQQDAADDSGCDCPEDPESVYLAHTPECLATITHFDVCSECARIEYADAERQAHGEFSGYAEALWPCPTITAIGGGES